MPFQIKKVGEKYKLWRINKKSYGKKHLIQNNQQLMLVKHI